MHGDLPGRGTAAAAPGSPLAVAPAGRYNQAQSSGSASSPAGQAQAAAGTVSLFVTPSCLLSKQTHLHLLQPQL